MELNDLMQSVAPVSPQGADAEAFVPTGVCSKLIRFQVEEGVLRNVEFTGGCSGNLQGIGRLVDGLPLAQVADRLRGITCGKRDTSCPDQLARAIAPYLEG